VSCACGCGGCCRKGTHRTCRHGSGGHGGGGLGCGGASACCCGRLPVRVYQAPTAAVGKLRGVIYRAPCGACGTPHNYVHFFEAAPPTLVTDPAGTRLYIVGGRYRITARGIEG